MGFQKNKKKTKASLLKKNLQALDEAREIPEDLPPEPVHPGSVHPGSVHPGSEPEADILIKKDPEERNLSQKKCLRNEAMKSPSSGQSSDTAHLQELSTVDVKEDPDFPSELTEDSDAMPGTSTALSHKPFQINSNVILSVPLNEQASELQDLGLTVYNQEEFEEGVIAQVDKALAAEGTERRQNILEKEVKTCQDDFRTVKDELQNIEKILEMLQPKSKTSTEIQRRLTAANRQKENKLKQIKKIKAKLRSLLHDLNGNTEDVEDEDEVAEGEARAITQALGLGLEENEYERMVRMGEMTPFGTFMQHSPPPPQRTATETVTLATETVTLATETVTLATETVTLATLAKQSKPSMKTKNGTPKSAKGSQLHRVSSEPNMAEDNSSSSEDDFDSLTGQKSDDDDKINEDGKLLNKPRKYRRKQTLSKKKKLSSKEKKGYSAKDVKGETMSALYSAKDVKGETRSALYSAKDVKGEMRSALYSATDDATLEAYEHRLRQVAESRLHEKREKLLAGEEAEESDSDMEFDRGFRVPGRIWSKLYPYQKTGVRWLWELHCQNAGGIVGDEMGLGKTIQIIAFLAALKHSQLKDQASNSRGMGPILVVVPVTVMHQWVEEFHTWEPHMRVAIFHSTGSYSSSPNNLIYSIVNSCGVLVTAYSTVYQHQDLLHKQDWHYVILDEGHKIRNPDAKVTLACKMFKTSHRLILTGSPMQNNLKELWSLFDFVFPGKLGSLPDFMTHFSIPIVQGGYSNANEVQVQTAYKCACVLQDTMNPYLLRRMKADVQKSIQLPNKNEQVLFCRLSDHQKTVYKEYLESRECQEILNGRFMAFPGLITLRKVCNHPDLSTGGPKVFDPQMMDTADETLDYGYWKRSGKMIVVESLLKLWRTQGHRVLLFSQSRQMLDIVERFVKNRDYTYMRMDGNTSIASRLPLVQSFNQDSSIFIFLLTTRVGGLGVNLTGANRVIIYDPDWNPSTDIQARERAWRIGQTRPVTIYRLLTTGSIEEKIYHRQIFKQFLSNRVLKDPKQRRFFKSNDLHDLFTLGDDDLKASTETSSIFAGTGADVKMKRKMQKSAQRRGKPSDSRNNRFDMLRDGEKAAGMDREDWSEQADDPQELLEKEPTELEQADDPQELLEKEPTELEQADDPQESLEKEPTELERRQNSQSSTEEKLKKMREMAAMLSRKIGGSFNGSSSTPNEPTVSKTPEQKSHECKKQTHDRNKKHKRKRKKEKNALLDGQEIYNLSHHSTYSSQAQGGEEEKRNSDDFVLEKLLKKKGVHSAMQHDKIMMSSDPDYALVESEANRVATDASRALKRSRSHCPTAGSGVPTWTGSNGGVPSTSNTKPRLDRRKLAGYGYPHPKKRRCLKLMRAQKNRHQKRNSLPRLSSLMDL